MKKKLYNTLAITLLAIALLILASRDTSDAIVKDTETISQESDNSHPQDTEGVLWGGLEEETELLDDASQVADREDGNKEETPLKADEAVDNTDASNGTTVDKLPGDDLASTESITSNAGVEIPVLNKFNDAGLEAVSEDDNGMLDWFGYAGEESASGYANVVACGKAMNELTEALGITGGFMPQQEHISFSFTDAQASTGDLELRRDFENGYYIIGINYDMSDEEAFYPVSDGKDALTLLCSIVSSTPTELAEFLYEESFVVEECVTSEDSWVAVGDCLVQWGGYQGNELDELVYRVKAK